MLFRSSFADLDMEIVPDEEQEGRAELRYAYNGNYVGAARVKLSESYIKAHTVETEEPETDKGSEKKGKKKDVKKEGHTWSRTDKIILVSAFILLFVFIIIFIGLIVRYKRLTRQIAAEEEEEKTGDRVRFEGYF